MKVRVKYGYRYSFRGLMKYFLKDHRLEEDLTDYKLPQSLRGTDVSQVKKPESTFWLSLTHVERLAHDDNVTSYTFGMQHLTMMCGGRYSTEAVLKKI